MHAFPPGVHLIGGQNAAPVHHAAAVAFYAPILPVVLDMAAQGLSLRAIARELDKRGIEPRGEYEDRHTWDGRELAPRRFQRWSATGVRRVLLRARQADSRAQPANSPGPEGEPHGSPAAGKPDVADMATNKNRTTARTASPASAKRRTRAPGLPRPELDQPAV